MSNFEQQTAVEVCDDNGRYSANLSKQWEIWGPNGGYLAAIALRAAGKYSPTYSPVSFSCQYLNVAKFEPVDIQVFPMKLGKTAAALDVLISQNGKNILKAQVWLTIDLPGYEHDFIKRPSTWRPHSEVALDEVSNRDGYIFWENFLIKPVVPMEFEKKVGRYPQFSSWYRFDPDFVIHDAFIDAARSLVLIDTLQWLAVYRTYGPGKMDYVAPSLDLMVQFHRSAEDSPWIFCDALGGYAHRGVIAGEGSVWNEQGQLIASGRSQLLCRKMA